MSYPRVSSTLRNRRKWGAALVGAAVLGTTLNVAPAHADEASTCAALSAPVYHRTSPSTPASILTTSGSASADFPVDNGTKFKASNKAASGLVPIRSLYNPNSGNSAYIEDGSESDKAVTKYDYTDRGVAFYAADSNLSCTDPVYRYRSGDYHRYAVSSADRSALASAGWESEGVAFYAAAATAAAPPAAPEPPAPRPPDNPGTDDDSVFSIAVIPDTQQEVFSGTRFINRTNWLVDHAAADDLDLRFVTHTGDVVNWDTDDHSQYKMASAAMKPLETAGIPYSLTIGNHDSQATGPGGDARDPKRTRILARDTSTFNNYFTAADYGDVSGAFESGKIDNVWSEFSAAGASWIVLNLEMWPRTAVVEWAKQVVAGHPSSNIIVVTHTYLTAGGGIAQGSGYGDTSPQYLYDNLISKYENVKMVFSGHVGVAATRVDVGKNGNKIYSFLAAIHSGDTNPVRIVTIDTSADTIASKIVAPYDNSSAWRGYDKKITGVDWAG